MNIKEFSSVEAIRYGKDNCIESCRFSGKNIITIGNNVYIPKYSPNDYRNKHREAVSFYKSGSIRSIYLENIQKIFTPLGEMEAELVTFYENGQIHRVFPLYGQISAYWSEKDEKKLAKSQTVCAGGNTISAKISCINFYNSAKIKSITLWSGEKVTLTIGKNSITARIGISFYESGEIESAEPVINSYIDNAKGEKVHIYNPFACGITGDNNSLKFDKNGRITSYFDLKQKKYINNDF